MRVVFTNKSTNLPLFIESIGNDWRQENVNRPQGYPYYHWLQTSSGQGILKINGTKILLRPQQGILIEPNVPHQYWSAPNAKWQTQYLTFGGTGVADIFRPKLFTYHFFNNMSNQLNSFISQFGNQIATTTDPIDLAVLLYRFLLLLRQALQQSQPVSSVNQQSLLKIQHYLEQHFTETIKNNELAKQVDFSPQHLNRQFKQAYQITPLQYLLDLRLRNAQALLLSQRELSIDQISAQTGFSSPSYFTAQFHKNIGFTPQKFRKMN